MRIAVRYPDGWHVNSGDAAPACSAFDPEPLELPKASEYPAHLGAVVCVEPLSWQLASQLGATDVEDERWEKVDERSAVRLETVATGQALRPAGERSLRWIIDAGLDRSIIAETREVEGNDFTASTEVLDRMVRAFTVHPRAN